MWEMGATNFRALYDLLSGKETLPIYWYVLYPWVESHAEHVEWLRAFAARSENTIPAASSNDLWELYALNRVFETLLLRFQQGRVDGTDYQGPVITTDEYLRFAESMGFQEHFADSFSPFYHEIVHVEQAADPDQPVSLLTNDWPCLMLGNMVFSRAGTHVSAGRNVLSKEIAETSTLYWAYRRKNRLYTDLSMGWGHNSQWRTEFRRDYCIDNKLHYNVDGKYDLNQVQLAADDDVELPRDERIELLLHRCFVKTSKPHDDLWPYDDRYTTTQ